MFSVTSVVAQNSINFIPIFINVQADDYEIREQDPNLF